MKLISIYLINPFALFLFFVAITFGLFFNDITPTTLPNLSSFKSDAFQPVHDSYTASEVEGGLAFTARDASRRNLQISAPATFTSTTFTIFLPLVTKPVGQIYGAVSLNGKPAEGIAVTIWLHCFSGGVGWELYNKGEGLTDAAGFYRFQNLETVPHSIPRGNCYEYYVSYENPSTLPGNGKLAFYQTHGLSSYTSGSIVELENFDISDVALEAPIDMSTVAFPVTFSWTPRSEASPDNYRFVMGDPTCSGLGCVSFASSYLGYTDSFTMDSIPPEFFYDYTYNWTLSFKTPSGGYGKSYSRNIQFSE
jgi:hypothetical protein